MHLHAPQYNQIGLGMDEELLEWLKKYTFREESRFEDLNYAEKIYEKFIKKLKKSGTLRAVIYGTIHLEATKLLCEKLKNENLAAFVGKVNMDQNCSLELKENTMVNPLITADTNMR